MTKLENHIGCIDGQILTVQHESHEVVLKFGGSEARLSSDAAGLLALRLSPGTPSAHSRRLSEQPTTALSPRRRATWERIAHLMETDLLHVGTTIVMTHEGKTYHAEITADGHIEFDGHVFDSPSPAAKYVTNTSRNGWQDWRVLNGPRLIDLRWMLRAKRFHGDDHSYSEATIRQKREIAGRWVEYALQRGLNPGTRNSGAIDEMLSGRGYAESTLGGYRNHLDQWFEQYDSPK